MRKLSSVFRNLSMLTKLVILAIVTPVAVVVVGLVAFRGSDRIKYEFDNLYGFTLLPIMDVMAGDLNREKVASIVKELLTREDITDQERDNLALIVRAQDEKLREVIERYRSKWLSTNSEAFSASLTRMGQQGLQNQERDLLQQIEESYGEYVPLRDLALSGEPVNRQALARHLLVLGTYFQGLLQVNRTFADLANRSAKESLNEMRNGVLAAGLLLTFLALLLAWSLARTILTQVNSIGQVFARIGDGDLTARAEVFGKDELGRMSKSLNGVLDNTLGLIQSREEKEAIQRSITKLQDEVGAVAQGDLTVKAESTTEITSAIAESFNYMIGQLRQVINQVQETTVQVTAAANEVQATTEHLAQGSTTQSERIVDISGAIDEMAMSIQQVSENAVAAAGVAEQALSNSRQGAEAVRQTMEGMSAIRNQVQETAKRIKRLGESSQEIGEIVELIGDIADRTSILALNASIQAAMAGDAGRGFAVVAEEVERLADRSAEATKRIATLIKAIQTETSDAVGAMEETTREVVGGSRLANEAGGTLGKIETVSQNLAELISSISMAAKQQALGSEAVAKSMNEISDITGQTAAGTKQAAGAIRSLAELAENLRESLTRFRLPSGAN